MDPLNILKQSDAFASLSKAASLGGNAALFGAHEQHRAAFAAALLAQLKHSVLLITEFDKDAVRAADDARALGANALTFLSRDFSLLDAESVSREQELARLSTLGHLAAGEKAVVCCSVEALCSLTMGKERLLGFRRQLKKGGNVKLTEFCASLVGAGYKRVARVEGPGQFSVRGGILDVFSAGSENPIRAELFGDEIERLFEFDPDTQRRVRSAGSADILPARESLCADAETAKKILTEYRERCELDELSEIISRDLELTANGDPIENPDRYLPLFCPNSFITGYLPDCIVMFAEPPSLTARHKELEQSMSEHFESLRRRGLCDLEFSDFYRPFSLKAREHACVYSGVFARSINDIKLDALVNINGSVLPRLAGDFASLSEELRRYTASGFAVIVYAGTAKTAKSWRYDLGESGVEASLLSDSDPAFGRASLAAGVLSSGFEIPSMKLAVLSGRRDNKPSKKRAIGKKLKHSSFGSLEDLHEGDYVVHINHGIGRYDGIHRIDQHGQVSDYIKINYSGEDILYLPVTQLDMVSPYVAPKEAAAGGVKLAKLYSGEWAKTKKQVYAGAREMAKELIELYKKRELAEGTAFPEDDEWQRDFEARFPFDETDDQLRSIREIKKDMQKSSPMDRLLCGDVGVGKTEVALRAAFKCVEAGKQCAVLVPTTILAWQHFGTFLERMEPFPIKVVMLSRFASAKDIRDAVAGIKNGTVDIAIGTHRLLQKDVKFRDLGLLIIDEEQRFGVSHKEKLREQFAGVDVLTLSATPIPRTLNMAMSGIRDMSVIEEPPEDRSPVQTYVLEYDEGTVREAIKRELARGGQVYYMHNRVDSIERAARRVAEWFPDAAVEVAHGQMSEEQLSAVWRRVMNGDCDILVCTTIIETGIDVPNCNTLIVEDSDRLGLAQLYQIRGRVGRSARRAYAYFTFRQDMIMSETAQKRLSAIRDFTSFGSGFRIAMQDLQIRGAGGILSARQSGHMQAVGYDAYVRILQEAVDDERSGKPRPKKIECVVDLSVNAYIPEGYIPDLESRLGMYKRIAAIENEDDLADVTDELSDRFGPLPAPVCALISVALLRVGASELGVYEIKRSGETVALYSDSLDPDAAMALAKNKERRALISPKGKSYVSVEVGKGESAVDAALWAVRFMADSLAKEPEDVI